MLKNPSFEESWTDLPPAPGNLINQQPASWNLTWLPLGSNLWDSSDIVNGVPECVHKLANQLPPDELPGAPHALILDGDCVYKIFHAQASFGAELSQTVGNLEPGSEAIFFTPIQVHRHGDMDPYAAEVEVTVNGQGAWYQPPDRAWVTLTASCQVPASGIVSVRLRVKSKWNLPKDFFIDACQLQIQEAATPPTGPSTGAPREQYARTYVLMPPGATTGEVQGVTSVVWSRWRPTIGGSADDAGIGALDDRAVIAVKPTAWSDDLANFFELYYPGVAYLPVPHSNSFQRDGRLRSAMMKRGGFSLARPLAREPYVTSEFGVDRGTYHHSGVDYRASWANNQDEVLAILVGEVITAGLNSDEPWFGYQVRTRTALPDGRVVFIRYAHLTPQVYVQAGTRVAVGNPLGRADNTGNSTGDHLHLDIKVADGGVRYYIDPHPLIQWEVAPGYAPGQVRLGFNDWPPGGDVSSNAARWMLANGLPGLIYTPVFTGTTPTSLDYSAHEAMGIQVLINLRYSYSTDVGGAGTFPPSALSDSFVQAMVGTIQNSRGVWGWTIGNEPNNPREWPTGEALTPASVTHYFQEVAQRVPRTVRLAPAAIDPFYGPSSNCRDWFQQVWASVSGVATYIDLHGYIRGPDPSLCWSATQFTDPPLEWQYRNYLGCCGSFLDTLPPSAIGLPVIISEFNHIDYLDAQSEIKKGWVKDARAAEVVQASVQRATEWNSMTPSMPIMGLALYRWSGDEWALEDNPVVLNIVSQIIGGN